MSYCQNSTFVRARQIREGLPISADGNLHKSESAWEFDVVFGRCNLHRRGMGKRFPEFRGWSIANFTKAAMLAEGCACCHPSYSKSLEFYALILMSHDLGYKDW